MSRRRPASCHDDSSAQCISSRTITVAVATEDEAKVAATRSKASHRTRRPSPTGPAPAFDGSNSCSGRPDSTCHHGHIGGTDSDGLARPVNTTSP